MMGEQRQKLLLQQLDLSGLDKWSTRSQAVAWALLVEYHNIFSLEPGELGCMDLAKHEIGLLMQTLQGEVPKNSSPMVDRDHAYVKEILEAGAICPSQSPWCNVVVLVCKKDGGLCFCIDFHNLNARTKKDSYLLPNIQAAIESLVGAGYFSCLDLKVVYCQLPWMKHQNNTPLSPWET